MRVLLDECLPQRLGRLRIGHDVRTVQHMGWAGLKNGALLDQIGAAFEAFITIDKNLPAQQNIGGRPFGVVLLRAPSNRLQDLAPLAPKIVLALASLHPGRSAVVD